MSIAVVGKTLKRRGKFGAAARVLGDGAPRFAPTWRARNPVPEPDSREHGYPRTELLVLARELRQASAVRELGSLGLVGGAWE